MEAPAFRLAEGLPTLAAEYDNMLACIRCGLCLTSCPTYVLSMHESEGPRGRVGMARALAEGHLSVSPELVEHELNCLVCDACSAVCPAGVHMDPLQVVLRSAIAAEPGWRERVVRHVVFGWMFTDLSRFRAIARLLWVYQRTGVQWLARRLGLLRLMGLAETERLLPAIPSRFVVPKGETFPSRSPDQPQEPETRDPAAFFAGCVMSTALADVDRATIRVLQRAKYEVVNPAAQGCCGALHAHAGDLARALHLARQNIEAFEATSGPIVVNSAGCGAMLKDYAHHLALDPEWARRAAAFSARIKDFSEAVVGRLDMRRAMDTSAVYQDACHLLHAQRISRQPRQLLKSVPGLDLKEIAEPGLCCGSAGIYNLTNPTQSRQLQQRKLDHALAVEPSLIVTANPGCLFQLRAGLGERGSRIEVKHLAEVLDAAT